MTAAMLVYQRVGVALIGAFVALPAWFGFRAWWSDREWPIPAIAIRCAVFAVLAVTAGVTGHWGALAGSGSGEPSAR
jgi:hypothetical protein